MPHPHQSLLREYKYAIDHLVPTAPEQVKQEAVTMYQQLSENGQASEEQIFDALIKTGKAEYPHRHAYHDLTAKTAETRRVEMVLEHIEEKPRVALKKLLASGADMEEIVRSNLFEDQFTPEERYQIQDGLMDAEEHLREELSSTIDPKIYEALVSEKQAQMKDIEVEIEKLKALASKDPKWKAEILDKVLVCESGFAVTEKDPELEAVKKEIEYWQDTLSHDTLPPL